MLRLQLRPIRRRPTYAGDSIVTGSLDGKVRKIGWLTTEIVPSTSAPVYLPNATFLSGVITNKSRNTHGYLNLDIPLFVLDSDKVRWASPL